MIFGFSLLFLSNKTKWCLALSSSLLYFLSNCYVPGRLFTLFYVSVLGYRMDTSRPRNTILYVHARVTPHECRREILGIIRLAQSKCAEK